MQTQCTSFLLCFPSPEVSWFIGLCNLLNHDSRLSWNHDPGYKPHLPTHVYVITRTCTYANLLICMSMYTYTKVKVLVTQCLTLCDLLDCSPPGSSVCGILQAGILEWVAMPFSRGCSQPRNQTWVSHMAGKFFTIWATRKVFFVYVHTYSQFLSW